jgi:hypothetical protein
MRAVWKNMIRHGTKRGTVGITARITRAEKGEGEREREREKENRGPRHKAGCPESWLNEEVATASLRQYSGKPKENQETILSRVSGVRTITEPNT